MESMIPIINKLQDVFNAIGGEAIDLPQIVVVGSQSAGKSSVLENIVGRDFLPRGSGIVTRRPLILQLINIQAGDVPPEQQEWGEFLHKPNEPFYNFTKIRQEIEAETDRTTGTNKGISPVPIRLRIYSPHVLNLTLVDLPGLTRVPVGDQPADIEDQIKRMILTYITRPNAIILAVSPANSDLSTSDALQFARDADPDGKRTLGVITKIDIMDKGTDALDALMGRIIPLKLGFIGVINRSQADISAGKSIRAAVQDEGNFFNNHPTYRAIASRLGTRYLASTLNKLLMQHIRECLPSLKIKIQKMMSDAQTELKSYGDPIFDSKQGQGALLLQVITQFSNQFRDNIDGKINDANVNELYGGARINYIFTEVFTRCIRGITPSDAITLNDIRTAIKNATGPRASLFVPEASFEMLVRRQISRLEEPSLQCVEFVYDELQRIVGNLEIKELMRFQTLREKIVEVANNLLTQCKVPTRQMIQNLIAIELAYINTNHEDFIGGGGAMAKMFEKMARAAAEGGAPPGSGYAPQAVQGSAPGGHYPGGPGGPAGAGPQPGAAAGGPQPGGPQPGGPGGPQPGQPGFFNKFFGAQPGPGGAQPGPGGPQPGGPGGRPGGPPNSSSSSSSSSSAAAGRPGQPGPGGPAPGQPPRPGQPAQSGARMEIPAVIRAANPQNDKERFETELIQNLLSSYFDIVRKNIGDTVPKAVMHFLVNTSKENVQNELVRCLYREDLFDVLLDESPITAQRRRNCRQMLEALQHANEVLNEVRDIHPF